MIEYESVAIFKMREFNELPIYFKASFYYMAFIQWDDNVSDWLFGVSG